MSTTKTKPSPFLPYPQPKKRRATPTSTVEFADPNSAAGLELLCAADHPAEPVEWLWPHRIALGKVTLIAGDPGLGKSVLALDVAARVSRGQPFPDEAKAREGGRGKSEGKPLASNLPPSTLPPLTAKLRPSSFSAPPTASPTRSAPASTPPAPIPPASSSSPRSPTSATTSPSSKPPSTASPIAG